MKIPDALLYTESHEWVRFEGTRAVVGITEYAQKEISDVVFVELPPVGKVVKGKESVCIVESVKAAFDIYAPFAGTVIDVNQKIETDTSLVNSDCYGEGWFFVLECSDAKAGSSLMNAQAYKNYIEEH